MEQLRVIGTEDDRLILATESGTQFQLAINDVLRHELRKAKRDRERDTTQARPSPRDIQAQIRAGLSTTEVAELLGIRREDVQRFEGPVLAEREHVVGQALAIPVLLGNDLDHDGKPTFGSAVRAKLAEASASGERWSSWKENTGWVIKLEFTAAEVDHDARWSFDPRRGTLSPQNSDAVQLSRQGSLPDGLIPRLRALDSGAKHKDDSRFDSGSFGPRQPADTESNTADNLDTPPHAAKSSAAVRQAAVKRAEAEPAVTPADTADLLEALRRRRGQREPGPTEDSPTRPGPLALFEDLPSPEQDSSRGKAAPGHARPDSEPPLVCERADPKPRFHPGPGESGPEAAASPDEGDTAAGQRRKGRAAMPSWDEIVFGARTDE